MASPHDWSRFSKRINVKATVAQLYNAWATRAGIERWFLRTSEFSDAAGLMAPEKTVAPGNKYKWNWYGYSDEVVEQGEITIANDKDLLEFSFGGTMKVRVQVKIEEGENIVELLQYDIPVDEKGKIDFYVACSEGWVFYLANLKSVLEGGIDLRNKNEKIKKVINS
jgi:uncharacterized protein YndB with AHSA1/START domain